MDSSNKRGVLAAAAGVVVGAGAVIATVVAMKDKSNKKKVSDFVANAKKLVQTYKDEASDMVEDGKEDVRRAAGDAIKTAEKVTKSAKKEVRKI